MYDNAIVDRIRDLKNEIEDVKKSQPTIELMRQFEAEIKEKCIHRVVIYAERPCLELCNITLDILKGCLTFFATHKYYIFHTYVGDTGTWKTWFLRQKKTNAILSIDVKFSANSQCELKKIGEEMKPIYDVVCK